MSNTTGSTTSDSVTTSFSTTVTVTSSTSSSSSVITTSSTSTSLVSATPSTTVVTPSTTSSSTTSSTPVAVTSTIVQTPTENGTTLPPQVVTITSTQANPTTAPSTTSSSSSKSSTPTPSALSASSSSSSHGLSSGGKIAIAVIIPVVVIAAAFILGLLLWRRRKARKSEEELRKNEMAEYGFNPNHDPTLAPAAAVYAENGSDAQEDNSGYRGWGATSSNRKASTTLGSNSRPANGANLSDSGSQPGGMGPGSEHYSPDPLLTSHPEGGDGVAALSAGAAGGVVAGAAGRNRNSNADVRRGPSNASSAYSTGRAQSEASSDVPDVPNNGAAYYQEEVPYNVYNDAQPHHGPYGDGSYGGTGGQPVIRDVQARRNTRIERAPTFPQNQGGISQNF